MQVLAHVKNSTMKIKLRCTQSDCTCFLFIVRFFLCVVTRENHLDFLPFRAWIGIWTTIFMLLIVAFDLSALVRYITRFTEESFASLIAIIFIAEAFKKLFGILDEAPINTNPGVSRHGSAMRVCRISRHWNF